MPRIVIVSLALVALVGMVSCSDPSGQADAELCQDLTNLQATVAFLASPPLGATVGDVRGGLDKLDGTWGAVHDNPEVPDDEDAALLQLQQDYRDAIEGVGDDDPFEPYAPVTRGIAEGLMRSYQAVRVRLVCPSHLQPG